MSGWDRDAIDLLEPGFIEFADDGSGEFGFIVVPDLAHVEDRLASARL